jgi:DHA1 family tetracycline resistance protein-like MFS transporter
VLNTVINSSITKAVYPEEVGGALGVSSSVESLTRVIGPATGGLLLGALGTWSPGALGAVIMAGLAVYVWRRLVLNPDPPLPERDADVRVDELAT